MRPFPDRGWGTTSTAPRHVSDTVLSYAGLLSFLASRLCAIGMPHHRDKGDANLLEILPVPHQRFAKLRSQLIGFRKSNKRQRGSKRERARSQQGMYYRLTRF